MVPTIAEAPEGNLKVMADVIHQPESGSNDEKVLIYYEERTHDNLVYVDLSSIKVFDIGGRIAANMHKSMREEHLLKNAVIKKLASDWGVEESEVGITAFRKGLQMDDLLNQPEVKVEDWGHLKEFEIVLNLPE